MQSRMPKYEKLRNRKLRRISQASEKNEQKSRGKVIWETLNGRLFIWVLTATVGAVATAMYTNHQNCIRDAATSIRSYKRSIAEIDFRRRKTADAIRSISSASELAPLFQKIGHLYPEFRDTPTSILELDVAEMRTKTKPNAQFQEIVAQLLSTFSWKKRDIPYVGLLVGNFPEQISDDKLSELKDFTDLFMILTNYISSMNLQWSFFPYCSYKDDFLSIFDMHRFSLELRHTPTTWSTGIEMKIVPDEAISVSQ